MYGQAAMPTSEPPPAEPLPLSGLRVVCFESRRSAEASRLIAGLSQSLSRERVLALLGSPTTTLVCRGPKPHAVLKACGLKPAVVVGEPNTWRDVLRELDERSLVAGRAVHVQEYGRSNRELL